VTPPTSAAPGTPTAYGDGVRTSPAPAPRVVEGAEIRDARTITVDVCVIGSGAGGAPVATQLAEAGWTVAIMEEGVLHETASFTARPRDMMPRLYRDGGQTVTTGIPPLPLPLGRAVGGTTLVNMATCFRTPDRVLDRWASEHGLEGLRPRALDDAFARVEERINVVEVPEEIAGANARIVARGARALGVSGGWLRRAVRGCVGSGVCAFGCPSGAKQHTATAWLPHAWAAGATTYTGTRALRVLHRGGRATGVEARCDGGGRLVVRADTVVIAAGALHTPLLLRRSGLGTASSALGRHLTIHPASAARARMDEDVEPWRGVPQSYFVDELASEGIMLEGVTGPPDQAAMSTPGSGDVHRERMLALRRTASFGVMVSDTGRGSVREVLGRPAVRYDLHRDDAERFRRGFVLLAEIFFAAGAREVLVPLSGVPPLRDGDLGPLLEARIAPRHVEAMAFHPLGTARAGTDPATSVVDGDLAVHGVRGVHVCDGSVVPTPLGVNPQVTIMGLSVRLADHLSGTRRRAR
jgi:choline dehydrogenase-like flavoprotein